MSPQEHARETIVVADEIAPAWLADRVPAYLARREADVDAVKQALVAGDFQCIQKIGHNMKGTGSSYGFCRITELGGGLESAAKAGNGDEVATLLEDLTGYLQSVDPQFAQGK